MAQHSKKNLHIVIIITVIVLLAISSYLFTKYLEHQTDPDPTVSTYLVQSESSEVTSTSPDLALESSATDILELLIASINDLNNIETYYYRHQDGQLEDISLEEYQLYVRLLRSILNSTADVYYSMTYSEKVSTQNAMVQHDPSNKALAENARYYWIETKINEEGFRLPILISTTKDSFSYLSRNWVRSCLELRNFANLYFGVLSEQRKDALVRMIYADSEEPEVIEQKASLLLDYYAKYIGDRPVSLSDVVSLRMDAISFKIPYQNKPDYADEQVVYHEPPGDEDPTTSSVDETEQTSGSESGSNNNEDEAQEELYHYVTIYKDQDEFVAVDVVPANNYRESVVINSDYASLSLNQEFSLDHLANVLGVPEEQYTFSLKFQEQEYKYLRLLFPDLELILLETENEQYVLQQVQILSYKFSLSGKYYLGQSYIELLKIYLYLDTLDFKFQDQEQNHITLQVKDGFVESIYVGTNEFNNRTLLLERSREKVFDHEWLEAEESTATE